MTEVIEQLSKAIEEREMEAMNHKLTIMPLTAFNDLHPIKLEGVIHEVIGNNRMVEVLQLPNQDKPDPIVPEYEVEFEYTDTELKFCISMPIVSYELIRGFNGHKFTAFKYFSATCCEKNKGYDISQFNLNHDRYQVTGSYAFKDEQKEIKIHYLEYVITHAVAMVLQWHVDYHNERFDKEFNKAPRKKLKAEAQ